MYSLAYCVLLIARYYKRDCYLLQKDLNSCVKWCRQWRTDLNLDKCKAITFTNKKLFIVHGYSLDCNRITRVTTIKDLGITLSQNWTFNLHINTIVAKSFKMLGFLKRTCILLDNVKLLK
jgi:hypothetical protein